MVKPTWFEEHPLSFADLHVEGHTSCLILLDLVSGCIWYVPDFGNPFCTVFAQFLRGLLAELAHVSRNIEQVLEWPARMCCRSWPKKLLRLQLCQRGHAFVCQSTHLSKIIYNIICIHIYILYVYQYCSVEL